MYYPILKLRSSEVLAINEIKKDIIPIIEVDNNAEEKTLDYLKDCKKSYYLDFKTKNNQQGAKSIIPICKQIIALEDFEKDYSYGNSKIYEIATQEGDAKTGNSGEWIKIGHTHHITLLSDLLSN